MSFILDYDDNYNMIKTNTNKSLYADLIMHMNLINVQIYFYNIEYIILSILLYNVNYQIDDCENIKFQSIIFYTHMNNSLCQYQM